MDTGTHAVGLLFAACALVGWTSLSFFIRAALRGAPLLKTTATVSTLNGLLLAPLAFASLPLSAFQPSRRETILFLVAVGVLMVALSRLTYYFAIRRIGPSRTIPVSSSTPVVTAFLAAAWLGEPVTLRTLFGLMLLIGGITAVVRADPARAEPGRAPSPRERLLGWLSAGATTFIWSLSGVMLKVISLDVHPLAAAAMVVWVGAPVAWAIALAGGARNPPGPIPRRNWRWLLAAALCQTLAVPSFNSALVRTLAVNVTAITSLQPLLAILLAGIFLREAENVTPRLLGGACMSVGGTLLVLL